MHRGMILGLLAGASTTEIPYELKSGLLAYNELKNEIKDFVNLQFKRWAVLNLVWSRLMIGKPLNYLGC